MDNEFGIQGSATFGFDKSSNANVTFDHGIVTVNGEQYPTPVQVGEVSAVDEAGSTFTMVIYEFTSKGDYVVK